MGNATIFPSCNWFEALADRMKIDHTSHRELGSIDCAMVVNVEGGECDELYEIVFESFGVRSVRKLNSLADAVPQHFVLNASLAVWREMIENIHNDGAPDLKHTLNYLTFPDDPMEVTGPDQLEVDAFYRYNESLQRFFNGAAAVATSYPG
jgi:hypothetical protein